MSMGRQNGMNRRKFLVFGAAGIAGLCYGGVSQAGDLVVIAHPSVTTKPSKSDLAAIFTTRKVEWSSNSPIVAFNFPAKHELRVAFDQAVLGMDADQVARYWIDRRIRGGAAPPKQVPSAGTIVKLVEKMPGAVGYVPKSAIGSSHVTILMSL